MAAETVGPERVIGEILHGTSRVEKKLRARNSELRSAIAMLRETLIEVEWVSVDGSPHVCPWCSQEKPQGHADDCEREAALKVTP